MGWRSGSERAEGDSAYVAQRNRLLVLSRRRPGQCRQSLVGTQTESREYCEGIWQVTLGARSVREKATVLTLSHCLTSPLCQDPTSKRQSADNRCLLRMV